MTLTATDIDRLLDVTDEGSRDFAESLYNGYQRYGSLTDRQEPYARKLIRSTGQPPEDEMLTPTQANGVTPDAPLTAHQQDRFDAAMAAIDLGATVIGLTGPAGTGKTFLTEWLQYELVKMGRPVQFAATTHPAAAVLASKVGHASTIHSLAGLAPHDDHTKGYRNNKPAEFCTDGVLCVDEASMMDSMLIDALIRKMKTFGTMTLILIGDESQLPPVAGGPMFTQFLRDGGHPVLALSEVVRQRADGSLAQMLEGYRRDATERAHDWPQPFEADGEMVDYQDAEAILSDYFAEYAETGPDETACCVLAYTNKVVDDLNHRGRVAQYGQRANVDPFIVGERVVSNTSVFDSREGVTLLANGQTGTVQDVKLGPNQGTYYVTLAVSGAPVTVFCAIGSAKMGVLGKLEGTASQAQADFDQVIGGLFDMPSILTFRKTRSRAALGKLLRTADADEHTVVTEMDGERRAAWAQFYKAKNGLADLRPLWARTVHKSQGMTCRQVIIDIASIDSARDDWRALAYVAMSRAQEKVILI